ncbi:MAG: putative LPS assembly protein LptD, partial [Urechidicola sp.]
IAADSLKWSPMNLSAGTSFFNKKLGVNIRATLDPYAIDVNGRKINTFNIDNNGSLFRLTNAGITMNYSLSSASSEDKEDKSNDRNKSFGAKDGTNSDGIFGEDLGVSNDQQLNTNNKKNETKKTKLYNSAIPWDLNLAYAMNYSNPSRQDEISSHSLMFSGNIELTPKWKVGFSSGYDIKNKGFTYTQLRFNRDLDSWRLSFNWVPFGTRTTYNFYIGVKSGILSDLKYDKQKAPDRRLF